MPDRPLFVGIDGGGSRCRARLCDIDERCLGEGVGGSANTRLGLETVFAAIRQACNQALHAAGLPADELGRLHAGLGLAGLTLASERARLQGYAHPFASMVAASDAYVACLGAHAGSDGAILILGTGSSGCLIAGGQASTLGGWGFQLSDQGSGARLGLQALRQALLAVEEIIPPTSLSRALMARFDGVPERAVLWADSARPGDYAALAPLVFDYARQGDTLARALLEKLAAEAALLIRALYARGAPRVALLGGLAGPLRPYLPPDVTALLTEPRGDALAGAVLMIRRHHQEANR